MKALLSLVAGMCLLISSFAGIAAIWYGVHDLSIGVAIGTAAWNAFEVWIGCSILIIPAAILAAVADSID